MEEKFAETIVSTLIKELLVESKLWFGVANDEIKQFLNKPLKKYLEKQRSRYSYIKTLLKGSTPVYLYDIYYPLKLTVRNSNDVIGTSSIKDLFSKSNYITLIGDAGSGKSTLIRHLFLNAIQEKYAIPILIELRYLNDYNNSFESYLYDKIFENKLSQNGNILERLLNNGKFVFFLDGFDELKSSIRSQVIQAISSFINQFGSNKFIITTRPYSNIENLQLFHNYNIKQLSYEEIKGFIYKQLQNENELAKKIVSSIETNKSEYINSFLTNPLLLSLYILTFQSDASIPTKKYIFYRRVINALFSEHDSKTKLGYVREKISGLNQEQFEEILKIFSYVSYFESKFNWDNDYLNSKLRLIKSKLKSIEFDNSLFLKDLKSAIALWTDDNGIISFAHRSLQEYFAALFVKHLNPSDNQRMYEKMITKFSFIKNQTEVKNFLSLCDEMDTINFKRYYLLPLLYELRKEIINSSDKDLVTSFLKFFCTGISIPKYEIIQGKGRLNTLVEIKDFVYRSIYLHLPFTQELHDILAFRGDREEFLKLKSLTEMSAYDLERSVVKSNNTEIQAILAIDFKNDIPEDFLALIFKDVLPIAKSFSKFIDIEINSNTKFISESESLDKEFVDLIG